MFGGAALALALDVAAENIDRLVAQGALQFFSLMPLGDLLELEIETLQSGRTLTQERVTGRITARLVFQAGVTLGHSDRFAPRQMVTALSAPFPVTYPFVAE